jgi:hypothetical protein
MSDGTSDDFCFLDSVNDAMKMLCARQGVPGEGMSKWHTERRRRIQLGP